MVDNVVFNCLNIDKLEVINETIHSSAEVTKLTAVPFILHFKFQLNFLYTSKVFPFFIQKRIFLLYYNS